MKNEKLTSNGIKNANSLAALTDNERIIFVDTDDKYKAFDSLIDVSYNLPGIKDRDELKEAVYKREDLKSTGIGMNIGIPHVRLDNIKNVTLSIAIIKNEITNYESIDNLPVKIVILIIAGINQQSEYIKVLSRIAKFLKDESIRTKLINASDPETVINILDSEAN